MALVKEYFELTHKYVQEYGENTVLLMQVGAFFEVYGLWNHRTNATSKSKIRDVAKVCDLSVAEKNVFVDGEQVVMAGFKDIQIEKYIRKLQDASYTVVVYAQDENGKNTTRSLLGIFSPGTYFHEETTTLSNSTACIWVDYVENRVLLKGKHVVVGAATIDIYTGKTTLCQFRELYVDSPTTYDELERFVSVHNPSEVILISNLPHARELDNVLNYAGIACNMVHKIHIPHASEGKASLVKNCEKQSYQREILSKTYVQDDVQSFFARFHEHHVATQAFCYLLDFMYQHNAQLVHKIAEPVFEGSGKRLSLANHSLKQLNIIPDGTTKPGKYSSVSSMLNHCLTPMGKRMFLYHVLNPLCDEDTLENEYHMTDYLLTHLSHMDALCKPRLMGIQDLAKFDRHICLKRLTPKQMVMLHSSLSEALTLFASLRDDATWMAYLAPTVKNVVHLDEACTRLIDFIETRIVLALARDVDQWSGFEFNFIQKGVHEPLDRQAQTLLDSEAGLEAIREYFSRLIEIREKKTARTASTDFVKVHETEKNHYSLLCTSRRCKLLREALPNNREVVHLPMGNGRNLAFSVSKTQFEFETPSSTNNSIVDPQISSLCRNLSTAKTSMKELVTQVYAQVVEQLGGFQEDLERIIAFVTSVDVMYTKAVIAKKYNYCRPTLVREAPKAFVQARGLRHALIEQFNTNEVYVSNDLSLGDGVTDGVLLFGTNAVGKTTFIRALGIAVVLAQAGLFVPCSGFVFKPYKSLFTRILGNDNLFKGLSTFEVEMSELRTILTLAREDSLVLGDELCSGTETISAISIFVAGIQQLHLAKSSFIFATHLHEVVDFDEMTQMNTVKLKHMEVVYNQELDALVYNRKLKDGPGANVYGLEVCKSLHLPATFLEMANAIRLKYNGEEGKSMLTLRRSRYNVQKVVHMCERCGKQRGKEVHHMRHQADANEDGLIVDEDGTTFHKNHLANLMTLCEACHDALHQTGVKQKRVRTSKGHKVVDI